jgi:peptide/nickel transport system substrate-binding protein
MNRSGVDLAFPSLRDCLKAVLFRASYGLAAAIITFAPASSFAQTEGQTREDTLVVATPTLSSENWAPHRMGGEEDLVGYSVFETLIRSDPKTREFIPGLAESWTVSDDLKTWTVNLKKDVPFHKGPNGEDYGTLTAEDVKFTWELYLRDDCLASRCGTYSDFVNGDISNFEVVNDHQFILHGDTPIATFPSSVAERGQSLLIVSKKHWDAVGPDQASRHPIGTGPWKFVSHKSGESVTLQAVENHHRKTPAFRVIPEPAAQLAQLRAGEADMMPISLSLLPEAEAAGLRIIPIPGIGVSSLYFGGHYPGTEAYDEDSPWIQAAAPEKGKAIREAISLAIDRKSIVDNLLMGHGTPVIAPIQYVPGLPFTDPNWKVPEYNLELAKQKLAEGGYPDGFEVSLYMLDQGGRPMSIEISEAIAGMLEELGLTVNRRPIDDGIFDEMREKRSSSMVLWQFIQLLADEPADRFAGFAPTDGGAEFYFQPIEKYVDKMNSEPDYDKRMALARELGQILIDNVGPAIGLLSLDAQWAVSDRVGDWEFQTADPNFRHGETVTKKQ